MIGDARHARDRQLIAVARLGDPRGHGEKITINAAT
jgi:hypothetical protein